MDTHNRGIVRGAAAIFLGLILVLTPLATSSTQGISTANAHDTFSDPAFQRVWNHCDKPVEAQVAARSWMWGPEDFYSTYEPYAQGPGGQHLVSYFDKSRMEINNPNADRNTEWFVTNGLLVVDMVTGKVQVGDNSFVQSSPANIPVAGDQPASLNSPTYATLANVASLKNDKRAADRTGQYVQEGLGRAGNVGSVSADLSSLARYTLYEPTLGHNIPDVFWSFMSQRGTTYHDSGYMPNDVVVDWMFAMGYPITEPYWIQISVGGHQRWVLMQAFQRRILTYSPYNPDPWKVEMANVGRAYYDWRYTQSVNPAPTVPPLAPTATATATPTPRAAARISANPSSGDTNTLITVTGSNFSPRSMVTISVEKSSANYARTITTVAPKNDSTFSVQIKVPSDAAQLGEVLIVASANGGAVRATASFRLSYSPSLDISQVEVVSGSTIPLHGAGFPAQVSVRLSMLFTNGNSEVLMNTRTDRNGEFDAAPTINKPVGTQFRVVAVATGGLKATTRNLIAVIKQPSVAVSPNQGPLGVNVSFTGSNWPANRAIRVSIKAVNGSSEAWLPNPIYSNGQGNFAVTVAIGREYARYSEIRLTASDAISAARLEASYYVNRPAPTSTPTSGPAIAVTPAAVAVGQVASVMGSGWPAGAHVSIGLGRTTVEESLGVATANAAGKFSHSFVLSSRWQNAGPLTITAYMTNGRAATTSLGVLTSDGRVAPSGLPMNVWVYWPRNGQVYACGKGAGWQAGSAINASIVSADGTLTIPLAGTLVNSDGAFTAGGYPGMDETLWDRGDLGIKVSSADGTQYSIRYLPYTEMVKVQGAGNTYQVTGKNWPASAAIQVVLNLQGRPEDVIGTATTDTAGRFTLQVDLPRIPSGNKNDVEIRAVDQPYTFTFDF